MINYHESLFWRENNRTGDSRKECVLVVRMEDQETDRSRNSKIPSACTGMDDSETWPIRLIYCWTLKDRGIKTGYRRS